MKEKQPILDSASANHVKNSNKEITELTEKDKLEIERKKLGPTNFNRAQRREHLKNTGVLRVTSKLIVGSPEWREWRDQVNKESKKLREENTEAVRIQQEWYLEQAETNRIKHLEEFYKGLGWSKAKIKAEIKIQKEL